MDLACIQSKSLMEAVQKNRQDEISLRLRLGDKVDTIFTMGRTALHCAAANSNLEAVSTLLIYSPDLKIRDSNGYTSLHVACSRAGPESCTIVDKLVTAGAELDSVNQWGRSPLHECVIANNLTGVRKLVKAGAIKEMVDSEGNTAREIAFSRNYLEIVEILSENVKINISGDDKDKDTEEGNDLIRLEAAAKVMSVEEEKENLKKRLAELEETENIRLENTLEEKRELLMKMRREKTKAREEARQEIHRLEQEVKKLQQEEIVECGELEEEISKLVAEIKMRRDGKGDGIISSNKDIVSCLECPVCLEVCKPPVQIWQCPEGHIMCGVCTDRPELRICPQCRVPLGGQLSRNRALEDLARKTFPKEAEKAAKKKNNNNRGGSNRPPRVNIVTSTRATNRGARRTRQVTSQVDQFIRFPHLQFGPESAHSDDDSYDLSSEMFLENVDDQFLARELGSSDSDQDGHLQAVYRNMNRPSHRSSAIVNRINTVRQRTSPGSGRRGSPDGDQFLVRRTGGGRVPIGVSPSSSPPNTAGGRIVSVTTRSPGGQRQIRGRRYHQREQRTPRRNPRLSEFL